MGLNKKTVDDINVKGQRVLCRCDFNVPIIAGKITDENRLVAALPTIKKLIAELKKTNPFVESNIFKSVENVNLSTVIAYKKDGVKHEFLEGYEDDDC